MDTSNPRKGLGEFHGFVLPLTVGHLGMGNIVDSGFGYAQPQQQQNNSGKPPPAKTSVIASLPIVTITADDLLEEANKECAVCLDDQSLGKRACKLPCGHLFHKQCVASWLEKHCTCPVCRFELETDDATYEAQRQQRMKSRKLRMRLDELQSKRVTELIELCRSFNIGTADCLDKKEIVDKLCKSGRIIITAGVPVMEMSSAEFSSKSVAQLKHLLLSFGISTEGVLEKEELRQRLLSSERIILVESKNLEEDATIPVVVPSSENNGTVTYASTGLPSSSLSFPQSPVQRNEESKMSSVSSLSKSTIRNMGLGELRDLCTRNGINISDCVDKWDVVDRIIASPRISIVNESGSRDVSSPHDQDTRT